MKRALKKWMALVLSIALLLPMVVGALPHALATQTLPENPQAHNGGDFSEQDETGRPNLYIDFLGDNMGFHSADPAPNTPGVPADPTYENWADNTVDAWGQGDWVGYNATHVGTPGQRIFWVGVGIDNLAALQLLQEENGEAGLHSLELGFYYNNRYIEPYVAGGDYKATLKAANIGNPQVWDGSYAIVEAVYGIDPQDEPITQENIGDYSGDDTMPWSSELVGMDIIMGETPSDSPPPPENPWKMTYISLEQTAQAANRFVGEYDMDDPETDTAYVLLIPFRLKAFDSDKRLCLRLARNATHFSIGGGSDGTEVYGAWERVTTRNPGHSLKLMMNFTGDLNIFTGEKRQEPRYTALLIAEVAGVTNNWAQLVVTDDPSPTPLSALVGLQYGSSKEINGLSDGTGMTLYVGHPSGYDVQVTVKYTGEDGEAVAYTTVVQGEHYTFLMPAHDVTVQVVFLINDATHFRTYLVEDRTGEAVIDTDNKRIDKNYAKVTANDDIEGPLFMDSDSEKESAGDFGASILVENAKDITLEVTTHPDYEALVTILTGTGGAVSIKNSTGVETVSGVAGTYLVAHSGTFVFAQTQTDIVVTVTYRLAATVSATLEVHHETVRLTGGAPSPDLEQNVAQLSHLAYRDFGDDKNTAAQGDDFDFLRVYSGVVYQDGYDTPPINHSAVEAADNRILAPVALAAATISGALGGDGSAAVMTTWDTTTGGTPPTFMDRLFAATVTGDLPEITALDLKHLGIRMDGKGNYFATSAEMNTFRTMLLALKDEAAGQAVPETALTLAQVQAYLLAAAAHAEDPDENLAPTWLSDGDALLALGGAMPDWPGGALLDNAHFPAGDKAPIPETAVGDPVDTGRASIATRPGRIMTLTLEASSTYQVERVELIDPSGTHPALAVFPVVGNAELNRDPNARNVYHFAMPAYDCTVKVTYTEREENQVALTIVGDNGEAKNKVTVTAHGADDVPTSRVSSTSVNNGTVDAFAGSRVYFEVGVASGYLAGLQVYNGQYHGAVGTGAVGASIQVYRADNNTPVTDMSLDPDEYRFYFYMPQGHDAHVRVNYEQPALPNKTIRIVQENYPGSQHDFGNNAFLMQYDDPSWTPTTTKQQMLQAGSAARVEAKVAPGSYIHSINVIDAAGNGHAYTATGNGYNGGMGGMVYIDLTMPTQDTIVQIIYRKGMPPAEPDYGLRVVVKDPDAVDPNLSRAQLTLGGALQPDTLTRVTAPSNGPFYSKYVIAGTMVELELTPGADCYVRDVIVSPAALGVAVEWLSATRVRFRMPGGDATVTAVFSKDAPPNEYLYLAVTQLGGPPDAQTGADNRIDRVDSPLLGTQGALVSELMAKPWEKVPGTGTTGVANPGEQVSMRILVEAGWHVESISAWWAGGSVATTLSDNGYTAVGGGTVYGTFIMPPGSVYAVVHYRYGEPPTEPTQHAVALRVSDPDNRTTGADWQPADNKARAEITGIAASTIPADPAGWLGLKQTWVWTVPPIPNDVGFATLGDTITVEYEAETGFSVSSVLVTASGRIIYPIHSDTSTAQFTMPDEPVTIEVRFAKGDAMRYNAELILRPPTGAALADAGDGTFAPLGNLDDGTHVYSIQAVPGERIDLDLLARDGYYIRAVEVNPAVMGVSAVYTGAFGRQSGYFIMPPANVHVNVYFEKAWPDEVCYDLTLRVTDPLRAAAPTTANSSFAKLETAGGAVLAGAVEVFGGGSQTLRAVARDKDTVFVRLKPLAGTVNSVVETIAVTDYGGQPVVWRYAARADGAGGYLSGIEFIMPPGGVTVDVRFHAPLTPPQQYTVTATAIDMEAGYGSVAVQARAAGGGSVTLGAPSVLSGSISSVLAGTPITVAITAPPAGRAVLAAWAVVTSGTDTGMQLIVPISQVTGGGSALFAMPAGDVSIFVVYGAAPLSGAHPVTLTVSGPADAGSATLSANPAPTTGSVLTGESKSVFAPFGTEMTVAIDVATGYHIDRVELVNGLGQSVPYTWLAGGAAQFTFDMPSLGPPFGAHVHVVLAEDPPGEDNAFTAQVVVNAGTLPAGNTAKLSSAVGVTDADGKRVTGLKAGDLVNLTLAPQPGVRIDSVVVLSARHGIAPPLTLPVTQGQTTSFRMPADDVIVYVVFVTDGILRYDATLVVQNGASVSGDNANYGTIHSVISGTSDPVRAGGAETVQAAAGTEWVTVEYRAVAGYHAIVTVTDGAGRSIPFTQMQMLIPGDPSTDGQVGKITFPMVSRPVTVTVTYMTAETTFPLTLHVIDKTTGLTVTPNWAKLTRSDDTSTNTGEISPIPVSALKPTGATATIHVPAGAVIDLDALAPAGVYIDAAYVMFADSDTQQMQVIDCHFEGNPPAIGFTGAQADSFIMHHGPTDVYVYFTDEQPEETEYAVALQLFGPETDTASTAWMTNETAVKASVSTNGEHAYMTAVPGDIIKVTVIPTQGLAVELFLITPLGIPVTLTRMGNTYSFPMPSTNVGVTIVLRESLLTDYTATLHLLTQTGAGTVPVGGDFAAPNYGEIAFELNGITSRAAADGAQITVPLATEVNLNGRLAPGTFLLAAYVLNGSELVPLSAALEGLVQGASVLDPTAFDAQATFTMPAAHVDVYLVLTDTRPIPDGQDWSTAVLLVTDEDALGMMNIGGNKAHIHGNTAALNATPVTATAIGGQMGHVFITVPHGDTVTVQVNTPTTGYAFSSAMLTTSPIGVAAVTNNHPTYTYDVTLGNPFNSAMAVHFRSTLFTKNPLTVKVIDADNPGDGTADNQVRVSPSSVSALTLHSTTPAGAWQVLPNIGENETIALVIEPDGVEYTALAWLIADGERTPVALTRSGDTYLGSLLMPGVPATLEIKFFRGYRAALTLDDRMHGDSYAQLYEDAFDSAPLRADATTPTVGFGALPNGTGLAVQNVVGPSSKLVGVVAVTQDGSSAVLTAGPDGLYHHTISRRDVEIIVVTDGSTVDDTYLAAVQLVDAPTGSDGSIHNVTDPAVPIAGARIWMAAQPGNSMELRMDVPAGYKAVVTSDVAGLVLSPTEIVPSGGTVSFTMPARHVNITVTFVKTDLTAAIAARGAGGTDTAALTYGATTRTVNAGAPGPMTITGLLAGNALTYTAAADASRQLAGMLLTYETDGSTLWLPAPPDGFVMPGTGAVRAQDVQMTAIFRDNTVAPDQQPYVATVRIAGHDNLPGNAAGQIQNETSAALASGLNWSLGYMGDAMRVSFTAAPGYYVTVTAALAGGGAIPIVQQMTTNAGTAYLDMPAADVDILITYSATPPEEHSLTLQLVGAGGLVGNNATLNYLPGATLSRDGTSAPQSVTAPGEVTAGTELALSANWAAGYTIERITLTVGGVEMTLPDNRYGSNASALLGMPGGDAVVTVYFRKVYTATLSIVGQGTGDTAKLEDTANPATALTANGAITGLVGDEEMLTTVGVGAGRRLVGVLRTDSAGVQSFAEGPAGQYPFDMPQEDVRVTAIFEAEPADEEDRTYIAMISFSPDSAGQTATGNSVTVKNSTDSAAPAGPAPALWAGGKADDVMAVTFRVAAGYQVRVTAQDAGGNPVYISRNIILPTGAADAEATLTMPGGTNVIITVTFIKGYDAQLELADLSGAAHTAAMQDATVQPTTISADSAAGAVGSLAAVTYTATPPGTVGIDTIPALPSGTDITVNAGTIAANQRMRILRSTPFGGTAVDITPAAPLATVTFPMPSQNTKATVLIQDENDPNDLLAMVALAGESDIAGNEAVKIEDITSPNPNPTTSGQYWTTTQKDNRIAVTFIIAAGYKADVTVRDSSGAPIGGLLYKELTDPAGTDDLSYAFEGSGAFISDELTVYLEMPDKNVTVVITYTFAGQHYAPYDPVRSAINESDPKQIVAQGHIYGENRRDYALVTIPTLIDDTDTLHNVTAGDVFRFYIFDGTDYLELEEGVDVIITPADPDNETTRYDYGVYYTDPSSTEYDGARFKLIPIFAANPDDDSVQAKALQRMLDNEGSLDGSSGKTTLFVLAERAAQKSALSEVLIRPAYGITANLVAYAPQHITYVQLFEFIGTDRRDPSHYDTTPAFEHDFAHTEGTGLWQMEFGIYSSELVGDPTAVGYVAPVYMLVIRKPGHMPYTRIDLSVDTADAAYNATEQVFVIADEISLIPGDLNWRGGVNMVDLGEMDRYTAQTDLWTTDTLSSDPGWANSVYNPDSGAYWADLTGDGRINAADRMVFMAYYPSSAYSYHWLDGADSLVLPFGYDAPVAPVTPLSLTAPEAQEAGDYTGEQPEDTTDSQPPEDGSAPEDSGGGRDEDDGSTPENSEGGGPTADTPGHNEPAPPPGDEDDPALPPDDEDAQDGQAGG